MGKKKISSFLEPNLFKEKKNNQKLMDRKEKLEVTLLKKSDCFDNLNIRKQIIYDIGYKSTKSVLKKYQRLFIIKSIYVLNKNKGQKYKINLQYIKYSNSLT